MIAHVSIPAADPRATALVLGALMDGHVFEFPVVPGAWIAVANDGSGTAIEVLPADMAHHPGRGKPDHAYRPEGPGMLPWEDQIYPDGTQLRPHAFHIALASPLDDSGIIAVAQAAGLRSVPCERGGVFGLIEVWLDDHTLVEVLSPHQTERYRAFMNPRAAAAMFGAGFAPALPAH